MSILYEQGLVTAVMKGTKAGPFMASENPAERRLWIDLKYRNGTSVLSRFRVVSKPSRRIYSTCDELMAVAAARPAGQVIIVNSPFGIVELKVALEKGVGGEVLCVAS